MRSPLSLSTQGKIFIWQDNMPLGKIIHGAVRRLDMFLVFELLFTSQQEGTIYE